jgi:hypothetical protein
MMPVAIAEAAGSEFVHIVDTQGNLTPHGIFSFFSTILWPLEAEQNQRTTLYARMAAGSLARSGYDTPVGLVEALLRPGALGAVDDHRDERFIMGLNAGHALRVVWSLAVAAPAEASLRTAWYLMKEHHRPALSWQAYRDAWAAMKPVAHFWAAIDQRVGGVGGSAGPMFQRFEGIKEAAIDEYTFTDDFMSLLQEAEDYRSFLEGRVDVQDYKPRKPLVEDISQVWRVPPTWALLRKRGWPPTGIAQLYSLPADLVKNLQKEQDGRRPYRKRHRH